MSANVANQIAFLRTSRNFPYHDLQELTVELNKAYLDTSAAVNSRTIGIFTTIRPAITGEEWFITGNKKQQGFRQVFTFTSTAPINHGINVVDPAQFIRCFGSYNDNTNSFGLIFGTSVAIPGQISFYVTSTQIIFVVDAAAPPLVRGDIVLEWLSQP